MRKSFTRKHLFYSLAFLTSSLLLLSCEKLSNESQNEETCAEIAALLIEENGPVTLGQTLNIHLDDVGNNTQYLWRGPNNLNSHFPNVNISDVKLVHEGWYHMQVNQVQGQCVRHDSVYIDVLLEQGEPACTKPTNTNTYNNMGTDTYTAVTKHIDYVQQLKALQANGNIYQNLTIFFHPHWNNKEPEDGIYYTRNTVLFGQTDYEYNAVFISTTKNSIYWSSYPNHKVYISHVGNKLQVRFCDLTLGGYNGQSYTSIVSGNVLEL